MPVKGDLKRLNPSSFEWIIPNWRRFLSRQECWITSPDIDQQDSVWYLHLHMIHKDLIAIDLCGKDYGRPKTITYTIKIKGRTDIAEMTKTNFKYYTQGLPGDPIILKKERFLHSSHITCYITFGRLQSVAGREFVTCAVQTEVPDCMSCAIQTEVASDVNEKGNPKDEDWSSLDMKGREFVTCAVQTEVTDCMSCAIQTEVASDVNEKENPKDEDWSSLDMKGVALLSGRMKELLVKGIEHDVTICVKDKKFRAHRSILSARSPVFAMMLAHDTKENNTGTISIEDCDPESFDEFLLYVYSGRTENLTPSNALQLYYPADKYDFPILKERCVEFLKTSLSVESICDVVLLAAKHQEKELLEVAMECFARNVKKILVTVGWQNFLLQNPLEANELYIKSMQILHPEN